MWFEIKGDARLGRCATEGCGGQPTFRLEAAGIGSNYCSGCRENIDLEPWDPRRDCPWKCKVGEENCRCMDEREDRRIADARADKRS